MGQSCCEPARSHHSHIFEGSHVDGLQDTFSFQRVVYLAAGVVAHPVEPSFAQKEGEVLAGRKLVDWMLDLDWNGVIEVFVIADSELPVHPIAKSIAFSLVIFYDGVVGAAGNILNVSTQALYFGWDVGTRVFADTKLAIDALAPTVEGSIY